MSKTTPINYAETTGEHEFWVEKIWHLPSAFHADGDLPEGLVECISDHYDAEGGIRRIFSGLALRDDVDAEDYYGGDDAERISDYVRHVAIIEETHTGFLILGRAAKIGYRDGRAYDIMYGWTTEHLGYGHTYEEAFADLTLQVKAYREQEAKGGDQ